MDKKDIKKDIQNLPLNIDKMNLYEWNLAEDKNS
jgi:hypothetical protein